MSKGYIEIAKNLNITNGYLDGTFKPNNNITRAEIVAMLLRNEDSKFNSANTNIIEFSDLNKNHWAYSYVQKAAYFKLVEGYPGNLFKPNSFATRAEAIVILKHYLDFINKDNNNATANINKSVPSAPKLYGNIVGYAVSLNWDKPDGAVSYKVYRSTVSGGPYTVIVDNINATNFVDTGISSGVTYYYVIKAVNENGESNFSNEVSQYKSINIYQALVVPDAPKVDENTNDSSITLSWENVSGASSYTVYKYTYGYNDWKVAAVNITQTTFTDSIFENQGVYKYKVRAVNSTGQSPDSNITQYAYIIPDNDNDGLNNIEEKKYGTNPNAADTDNDGIDDYTEIKIGTNPLVADTDGDGLPDGYEYYTLNTNPSCADSDSNGVKDSDEDIDNDELTNLEEYNLGTNPFFTDTDGDDLSDYDEVKTYNTDPKKEDTDGDGLNGGDEIKLGFNPNKADSNENGIIDSKEKTVQVLDLEDVVSSTYSGISVIPSLKISAEGNADDATIVDDVYDNPTLKSMRYIVGHPIEVKTDSKFDWMEISFKMQLNTNISSSKSLDSVQRKQATVKVIKGQEVNSIKSSRNIEKSGADAAISLDNLVLAEFDQKTNKLIPLDSTIDVSTNTIKAQVDHDGIFLLVDKNILQYDWDTPNVSSTIEKGKADIAFVLDSTGSMGGTIDNVKNNIVDFVNSLNTDKVDANLGLVEFKDIDIDADGPDSTKNYGWFNNPEDFKNAVNGITASGGGDEPESDVDGLEEARRMGFRPSAQKFIILITDAPYKENTRFPDLNSMQEEVNRLKNDNIITSVISSDSSCYQDVYSQTNGIFSDIYSPFASSIKSLIDNIKNNVTDGTWVRLTDGSIVKLKTAPDKNDKVTDTDGDGIPDSEELGDKINIEYPAGSGKYIEA